MPTGDPIDLLHALVRQIPGVVYQFRLFPDGRTCMPYASEGLRRIFAVEPEEVRDDASAALSRLHPDDLSRVIASIEASARTLRTWHANARVVLPERGVRWIQGLAQPERLSDGSTLWHGSIHDTTSEVEARRALEESEARYRSLIEHAPEAIVVLDSDTGFFVDANPGAERLFGLTRDEMLQTSVEAMSPVRQRDGRESVRAARAWIQAALEGGRCTFEWVHRDADGKEVLCEVRLLHLPDSHRRLVRGSLTDITERRRQQEALLRLETAIDSALNGIAMADMEGRLQYANSAFVRMLGYGDPAELVGVHALDLAAPVDEMAANIASLRQNGTWRGEQRMQRKDGSIRVVQVSASLFRDPAGNLQGMLGAFADVTEARRMEEQLAQARKMESVGRLAGGIAHDFNNLLTVMQGYMTFVLERQDLIEGVREELGEVQRAIEMAGTLTHQLLTFSRKQVITPQVLDLNAVVRRMQGLLARMVGEDIKVEVVTDPELPRVRFDPGQVEQILLNLAANARDAMPRGGVLTLETAQVRALPESERTGVGGPGEGRIGDDLPASEGSEAEMEVLLAVSDTGQGMSSEVVAHAFEPFYTTKEQGKGTGLGLAMIHGAVNQNGGRIALDSEPGQGTAFKIYLPPVVAPSDGPRTGRGPGEHPGKGGRNRP